jgi:hypothetical protein
MPSSSASSEYVPPFDADNCSIDETMGLKERQKARMKILTKKRKATTNKFDKVNKTTLVKKKHFQTRETLIKSPVRSGPSGQLKIVVKKRQKKIARPKVFVIIF